MDTMSTKKSNAWITHVKQVRKDTGLSYKDALVKAKETYKPTGRKSKRDPNEPKKKNPWMVHIDQWKQENPDWKKEFTYKQVLMKAKQTYTRT